ncbi:35164_t:CDS:1, partial [Racocetra persica]
KSLRLLPVVKPYSESLLFRKVSNPTANLTAKLNQILELAHEHEVQD